ncbi:FAD-dependent monooxygenase [Pseudonocardia oroxyli]|uniref:FAD binding domain-containing protein n=1 Tax=Pseudonocardia oroxyli TaxID=366584 RepID=A0A1G7RWH1_PSEOR|nr:FAD-dependent monooxygenase [Pseudonocardia oroxyli]SDG15096.1 FAD binding domain-containing protein [Pseudonocardia oroxyli]
MEPALPPDMSHGFAALPQYETERLLGQALARHGVEPERGVEPISFTQDEDGVTAELVGPAGAETVRARYLVGGDAAHSIVPKTLGFRFEGGAFTEEHMLGDVEVEWSIPPGYGIRATREEGGRVQDLLVCIPLPGRGR